MRACLLAGRAGSLPRLHGAGSEGGRKGAVRDFCPFGGAGGDRGGRRGHGGRSNGASAASGDGRAGISLRRRRLLRVDLRVRADLDGHVGRPLWSAGAVGVRHPRHVPAGLLAQLAAGPPLLPGGRSAGVVYRTDRQHHDARPRLPQTRDDERSAESVLERAGERAGAAVGAAACSLLLRLPPGIRRVQPAHGLLRRGVSPPVIAHVTSAPTPPPKPPLEIQPRGQSAEMALPRCWVRIQVSPACDYPRLPSIES